MRNMTVIQFAKHYIPSDTKVKIVKQFNIVFEGNGNEICTARNDILISIVDMIGAEDGIICLSCHD